MTLDEAMQIVANGVRRETDQRLFDAYTGTHTSTVAAAPPADPIAAFANWADCPWGKLIMPSRARCCEYAAAALKAKLPEGKFQSFFGVPIVVDPSVPLGRIRFENANGQVIEEFQLAPDALI